MPGAMSPIGHSTPGIKEKNMSLTPEKQAFLAELKINRPDLIQQLKAEFDEKRKEVFMNDKQQIEAVKQMARRTAGIPTAPSKELGDMVVKSVLKDVDEHVREKLDIPVESFKTLDDDNTEERCDEGGDSSRGSSG